MHMTVAAVRVALTAAPRSCTRRLVGQRERAPRGGRPRRVARPYVQVCFVRIEAVWRGVAWRGVAWRGVARRGVAWRGVAWRGVARRGAEAC
jgi:hypothetical protein